jgi:hypothetical protein
MNHQHLFVRKDLALHALHVQQTENTLSWENTVEVVNKSIQAYDFDKYLVVCASIWTTVFILGSTFLRKKARPQADSEEYNVEPRVSNHLLLFGLICTVSFFLSASLFSRSWEHNKLNVSPDEVVSRITNERADDQTVLTIKIGLLGFNITYGSWNEEYLWSFPWRSRNLSESFERSLTQGIPLPIAWVSEAMTIDAEGIKWGREYRYAGYIAWNLLWGSLTFLVLGSLLYLCFDFDASTARVFFALSSVFCLFAIVSWILVRPSTFLVKRTPGLSIVFTCISFIILCILAWLVSPQTNPTNSVDRTDRTNPVDPMDPMDQRNYSSRNGF